MFNQNLKELTSCLSCKFLDITSKVTYHDDTIDANRYVDKATFFFSNRAAKIINGTSRYSSSTQALNELNWKNLDDKLQVNEAITINKIMNNNAPS